jgi:hypothetical protein
MNKVGKIWITCLFGLFCIASPVPGQNYTFESAAVPTEWSALQGTLAVSAEHYKEGSKSLQWTTTGVSELIVTLPSPVTINASNSAFMQIYVPAVLQDTLVVEFMNGTSVKRTAYFLCNTRGWREFSRAYKEYASTASTTINALRITLKPADAAERQLFFDDIRLDRIREAGYVPGTQWLLDRAYMTTNNRPLNEYANTFYSEEIPASAPSAQELSDLQRLRNAQSLTLTPAYNAVQAMLARNYVNNQLNKPLNTTPAGLVSDTVVVILQRLVYLAGAVAANGAADMTAAFSNYIDYLLDQGFAEGCNIVFEANSYTTPRSIIPLLLSVLPVCNGAQQEGLVRLARWISFYGAMYEPEAEYLGKLNSDVIYLFAPYMQTIAMFHPDDAVAVHELKAVKRFLERNTEYVPGGNDMLKPDGTGFHHNTHYNNYMYSYQSFLDCIYAFKGTEFRLNEEAYKRFRKAIVTIYTMATLNTNDTRHYAHTFSGRNPFAAGMTIYFSKSMFEKLVETGGDCMGTSIDEELAGAYNYFFQSNKYAVDANVYEGFYAFNYSPAAIFRQDNWVATMHAPTAKLWGSEIYSGTNRFGRYQSHGALEITYGNGTLAASGYPTNSTGGGWDWNVIPGTTSVHYTSWQEMMPNKNTTDRFDQYTKTKNFSGGLSFGDCGVFATDFDQTDNWGSQRFTPTNLVFKKSMFAFENMIISLGSDISSSGTYSDNWITATNLFQEIPAASNAPLVYNGNAVTGSYQSTVASTTNNWLITPQGTGYYIPQANDSLVVFYDTQTTPKSNGSDYASPSTTLKAAKAYLKHGVKPTSADYVFVVVPAATQAVMENLASSIGNDGGDLFTVESLSSTLHALTYKPLNITAYSFFSAVTDIPFGIVESVSSEHLLMDKWDPQTGRHEFAVVNPNLNPQTHSVYGWIASPTATTITLKGEWLPVENTPGVVFSTPVTGKTTITVTMNDGNAVYFTVKTVNDTKIASVTSSQWFSLLKKENHLDLQFSDPQTNGVRIAIYDMTGKLVYRQENQVVNQQVKVPLKQISQGIFACVVSDAKKTETHKFIW